MTQSNRMKSAVAGFGVAALLAGAAQAGDGKVVIDDKAPVAEPEAWTFCNLFDYSTLYENDQGPINEISLIGRYHGQWHSVDSNQGADTDWENRRFRFGTEIVFLDDFTFEGQFNLKRDFDEPGRFFDSVEDLTIAWEPNDEFYLIVGKQKAKVSREWSTSSKRIKTMERSLIINQTVADKMGGVVAGYNLTDKLWIEGGIYTGAWTNDGWNLPDFNGDIGASARIGYDLTESTEVRFDYLYTAGAGVDAATEEYEHVFSWNTESEFGDLSLVTDVIYASGIDNANNSDVFGVVVMPYYALTEDLEAVFRYQYVTSDSDTGVRLQSRYERAGGAAPLNTRGDSYNAFYLGLNYYICDDKLKLMTGVEYATLEAPGSSDWDGWTYWAGVRMYF